MLERLNNVLRDRKESEKGFSLVELAVVIVIIGILVAIAVPVFGSLASTAEDNANRANASNGVAMLAAAIAESGNPTIPFDDAEDLIEGIEEGGVSVGATLTAPSPAAPVSLSNFCVSVGGQVSGPDCPAAPTP